MPPPDKDNLTGKGKEVVEPGPATIIALDDIARWLQAILKELQDHDDEGEYSFQQGTATTDLSKNIIDILAQLEHPVKGYIIKNDGANTIEVGHNITQSMIDSNLQTATARFYPLFTGESHKEMFNRKVIRNIYIRTAAGTSAYRLWLLW